MQQVNKKNLIIVAVLFLIAFILGGLVCYKVYYNGGTAGNVGEQLERASSEQQKASGLVDDINAGLEDSQQQLRILDSTNQATQGTADRISEANRNIGTAIDNAKATGGECSGILTDSQRRITESQRILQEVRIQPQADGN